MNVTYTLRSAVSFDSEFHFHNCSELQRHDNSVERVILRDNAWWCERQIDGVERHGDGSTVKLTVSLLQWRFNCQIDGVTVTVTV